MANLNLVEDVLITHMYRYPICENIIRMNESLTFEHETNLPDGNWLLIIFRYDSKSGLTVDRIFERDQLKDVTKDYANHPNVINAMVLIKEEIGDFRAAK